MSLTVYTVGVNRRNRAQRDVVAAEYAMSNSLHSRVHKVEHESSPNFLHFVGLDRGRHPGLPWGVAGVTRRSTYTESLSQSSETFGDSNLARQPEMCRGQSNTTGVLSSFCCPCVLSMRIYSLHVTCNNMGK
jgi:hypothetical protein